MKIQRKSTLFFLALSLCMGLLLWQQTRPVAASGKTGALSANQRGAVRNGNVDIGAFQPNSDTDGDGVPDVTDNCPTTYNPEKIAFRSQQVGGADIFVMNADGSNPVNLTNGGGFNDNPVISPNGAKIAFASNRDGNFEIYLMNVDGTNLMRLTDNSAVDVEPVFSPDGTKIAFTSNRNGNLEIYLMNADGTGMPINLTNHPGGDSQPAFSPDGTKIAFNSNRSDFRGDIFVMNADGSNQTQLTVNFAADADPVFSPDGAKIAFASTSDGITNGNLNIYVMNADGSHPTRLTVSSNYARKPTFSPDGAKIAFVDAYSSPEIYVMNADGSNPVNLTNNSSNNYAPSWGRQADTDGNGIGDACETPADSTPPVITPTVAGTLGNNNWYTSNVQVSWSVMDAESTVSAQSGCSTVTVTADTASVTFTCSATSAGGTNSQSVTVKRDATAPILNSSVAPNPVFLNGSATATPNASDALSGIASSSCGMPNTTTVGSKSVNCTATDNAGNTATASANYRVIYNFSGFLQPVNNAPVVNSAAAGQSIPVKFSLSGNQGLNIFETGFPRSLSMVCGGGATNSIEETVNPGASSLSYDATTDRYNYVWKTEKAWKGTCRKLAVKFNDGSTYEALFQFK